MMQVFGRSARYMRDIHILCAPTSEIAMSVGPEHLAQVPHDLLRLDREALVLRVLRAVLDDRLAHRLERSRRARGLALQRDAAQRLTPMSPSTPTATM